jgi:GNAT superfamily N-acetyltransferase
MTADAVVTPVPGPSSTTLRRFQATDSVEELTSLLRRAHAGHTAAGRDKGECWVAVDQAGGLVGTVTLSGSCDVPEGYPAPEGAGSLWWLAVDPALRGSGLGARLLALAEDRMAALGARQAVIDTSASAQDLLSWYRRRGYGPVGSWRWSATDSDSVVLAKPLRAEAEPPRVLNLWRHQLGEVPESVWERTDLDVLILADNGLTHVPPEIGRLSRLTTLDLGHNRLTSVPDTLGDLTGLSGFLYLHDNRLTTLPDALGRLTRLRYLNVGENALTRLPDAVGGMTGLIELRAQHNRLTALPDTLGGLSRLRELWLRGNQIDSLPPSLAGLHDLRHLDLRENALAELPPALAELPRLRHLDVRSNRLTRLPGWLLSLPALEKLDLRWNPCVPAPALLAELETRGCVVLV